jgi:hypothetical protein
VESLASLQNLGVSNIPFTAFKPWSENVVLGMTLKPKSENQVRGTTSNLGERVMALVQVPVRTMQVW